ncbi:MAG: hypothetical protein E3J86_00345, partial [Candidatus Thorarchaeota archaeon]
MVSAQAQRILKSILRDIPKVNDVTTTELLYRCQELSWILDLDDKTKRWIQFELKGYPPQWFGDDTIPEIMRIPLYRLVSLPAICTTSRRGSERTDSSHIFSIVFPCHSLETAKESITLSESTVDKKARPPMILMYTGEIQAHSMFGISAAIRGHIHLFATQQTLAIQVGKALGGFFDNTLTRIADTIGILAPSTLNIMNEVVTDLNKSKSPEEQRVILETMRTVVRRVTGVLVKKGMLVDDEDPPAEGDVATKTTIILDWAAKELNGKSKGEVKHLKDAGERY